jgi:hypothetical protein
MFYKGPGGGEGERPFDMIRPWYNEKCDPPSSITSQMLLKEIRAHPIELLEFEFFKDLVYNMHIFFGLFCYFSKTLLYDAEDVEKNLRYNSQYFRWHPSKRDRCYGKHHEALKGNISSERFNTLQLKIDCRTHSNCCHVGMNEKWP